MFLLLSGSSAHTRRLTSLVESVDGRFVVERTRFDHPGHGVELKRFRDFLVGFQDGLPKA